MNSNSRAAVYLGLVHWPVLDKAGSTVVTNVTNFDIHDIARACRTYGVQKYFIINSLQEQLMFVSRVLDHWKVGKGAKLNPMRKTALDMVELEPNVEAVLARFEKPPVVICTAARDLSGYNEVGFAQLKERIVLEPQQPILLLFGTGFGLHEDVLKKCHGLLSPIRGSSADDYRHLSVRSAVSIVLDRLLGA